MHELRAPVRLRHELEEITSHLMHSTQRPKKPGRGRRRALSRPGATSNEGDGLPPRGPPEMDAKWQVDVDDRVGAGHASIDHRPRPEPIDDPRILGGPAVEDVGDLIERSAPPARQPLDLIDLVNRDREMTAQSTGQGRLASASVSDDRDTAHVLIVTWKRERGPPSSRGQRTSLG